MAFVSSDNSSSTNETVNTAHSDPAASTKDQASTASYADDVMLSFFSNQSNAPQLDNKNLEQIDADDLEEMDLKWQVAMLTMRVTRTGVTSTSPERARVFTDLSAEEKERYKADIRATNILLQGIPKDIYTLINHYTDAKDIWDNVKMILEGSELTKDDRESQLYDEFERFFNFSKFVNNMLPEWSRFITEVKLNRGLKESNFDQLYAYLKQHEVHANENRMMMERFIQPTNDPLALVSNALVQQYPTQSSESPQFSNQPSLVDNCQMDTSSTSTDN
ncbi:hypothetical protein Tco_0535526 [Tanacetum coccineum]